MPQDELTGRPRVSSGLREDEVAAQFSGLNRGQQTGFHYGDTHNHWNQETEDVRWKFIKAINYPGMNNRMRNVYDAAAADYELVWSTSFKEWLGNSSGDPYWIMGKAGSGKSTLMKYISSSKTTLQFLPPGKFPWTRLTFYYDFRAGVGVANKISGMLRSFAQQMVERLNELVGTDLDSEISHESEATLVHDLTCWIPRVLERVSQPILAFIDGLDEYSGEMSVLVRTIDILRDRTNMKICLASRPDHILNKSFKDFSSLKMQEWNTPSISRLLDAAIDDKSLELETEISDDIKSMMIQKSQGVILWARLVIVEILELGMMGESPEALKERLDGLPEELGGIYTQIIGRIRPRRRSQGALILRLVCEAPTQCFVQHVHGAYVYLVLQLGLNLPGAAKITLTEFCDLIFGLFGSLLDLVKPESEEDKYLQLTHKSLNPISRAQGG